MNMYVCIRMHLVQKGGESPSFHQVLVGTMHLVQKGDHTVSVSFTANEMQNAGLKELKARLWDIEGTPNRVC